MAKNELYSVGALFSQVSKGGMKYLSGWMFRQSGDKSLDDLQLLVFPKQSKSGKMYYTLSISMLEGETKEQLVERINKKIQAHVSSDNYKKEFKGTKTEAPVIVQAPDPENELPF